MTYVGSLNRCCYCGKADAVLRYNHIVESCFDCLLDRLEPIEPGWGVALELKAEGYDYLDEEEEVKIEEDIRTNELGSEVG